MELFRPDSELMEFLNKVVDYIFLNLLCLLFSLPIVTIGAAFTAKFYVSMKIVDGQEPHVWKSYVKSFKENFGQATQIWLIFAVILGVLGWDWYSVLFGPSKDMLLVGKSLLGIMTFLVWSVLYCSFAMLARFHGKTFEIVKGAAVMAVLNFPIMLLFFLMIFLPYAIEIWYVKWALFIWLLATTVSLYYTSRMMHKQLQKLERGENNE